MDYHFLFQDRPASFDTMRFPTLETQLLDIMRTTQDAQIEHFKGKFCLKIIFIQVVTQYTD